MRTFNWALLFILISTQGLAAENLNHVTSSGGSIYFAWDGESGVYSADDGQGAFTLLGGDVAGPEGDAAADCSAGTVSTATKHYTVIESGGAASSSIPGSLKSLKTPYAGSCNNESFLRDTTVIQLDSDKSEIYIRWYQKFTGNWMNGSVQHKFAKMTPLSHGGDDVYSTGYFGFGSNSKNLILKRIINVEGQFDTTITRSGGIIMYSSQAGAGEPNVLRYWDNYDNGISGADGEFYFETNRWYAIEIHVKVNSDATTADAVAEVWIDGVKTFGLTNFRFYGPSEPVITGIGLIELQHIYYNRATNDNQPTYMDNIVVANKYIGPIASPLRLSLAGRPIKLVEPGT